MSNSEPTATPDLIIRLAGDRLRPDNVPLRKLALILTAVQKLVEPRDDEDAGVDDQTVPANAGTPSGSSLHLLGVMSGSAQYAVAAHDGGAALRVIGSVGNDLQHPTRAEWSESTLVAVEELSAAARSLGCEIEIRRGDDPRDILATITPTTYDEVESAAFVRGPSSVFAKLERVGGARELRAGIRLPQAPNRMVFCSVANPELVRQLGRFIYKTLTLRGDAVWLRHGHRLKTLTICEFEPPPAGTLSEALGAAYRSGGDAWDAIEDPEAYLSELRRQ